MLYSRFGGRCLETGVHREMGARECYALAREKAGGPA
jgi:hypothetical protein